MNQNSKISEILLKYKTDKNHGSIKNIYKCLDSWEISNNPEPIIGHSYGKAYDHLFDQFDKESNLDILEIGIQKGGSLCAWKDFFKNSNIYGVDIIDSILPEYKRSEFTYLFSDIKNLEIKNKFNQIMFDIIIDDGSHIFSDVLFVTNNYLDKLKLNGILIIEDCQQPEIWFDEISKNLNTNYNIAKIDLRNDTPYSSYDNFLIIIKRIK